MSEHPIELSTRIIESGHADEPVNRITGELSELSDDVALVESFSHMVAVRTNGGLVVFDTSGRKTGPAVVDALRSWSTEPIHSVVYTHGHLDHVGGSPAVAADATARSHAMPQVIGHENVNRRLDRYAMTDGYNRVINLRQFGGAPRGRPDDAAAPTRTFLDPDTLRADVEYADTLTETIGSTTFEFRHALGETDDHTWTWIPEHSMICAGDQFIWNFPNCGNPQKVQRYPMEWAASLRAMAAVGAELFVPAHGLPIAGRERIATCLDVVATTLEVLVADVIDAMNSGATLDEIVHSVGVDEATLQLPYLRPLYDEPEFVVRNIWRLYGGWYDGTPSRLKPAPDGALGAEVAALAGGADALVQRARALAEEGDLRLACHLADFAASADPESATVHAVRAEIYEVRRKAESSLMAKGIFASAKAESEYVVTGEAARPRMRFGLGE
ncbi:MAG: alkyl sulfatase dimerization domain-containing protein [Actinomycetota bacterium]